MKLLRDKKIAEIRQDSKTEGAKAGILEYLKNISTNTPTKANALDQIQREQLDRISKTIDSWRMNVDAAEDIDNPDRQELMEMYRDFVDDYQLFAVMQTRINKAISGSFRIIDENNEEDEDEQRKFVDPDGHPHSWFRDFMRIVVEAKFYGWEAIQLGDVIDDQFAHVEKIPEENTIPYWDMMKKDASMSFQPHSDASIDFKKEPYNTWVVRTGYKDNLGLINKCAPYIIWKKVFGSWAQHASIFGSPLRVASTDINDNARVQNLINMLEDQATGSYTIKDPNDELEYINNSGATDPHQIYGMLIDKCDSAISKIVLGQTGTTDEKAYSGSANVHAVTEDSIIYSDKLDIKAVVNELLIPRMKKIGMISDGKKVYGSWDFSEKMTTQEWSKVFLELSQAGYTAPAEEVTKRIGVELDETVIPVPDNKTFSVMNMVNKMMNNGKNNS